jgi:uncharacterized protein YdeI (YjbR/CyaY-like superfamily)
MSSARNPEPPLSCESESAWAAWLAVNHAASSGVWLRLAKKSSNVLSISCARATEIALCYGWIDGQKMRDSEQHWLQRFTPRTQKSIWSKINRQKALALIASGDMKAAGLQEIERAKSDGRWRDAYDSARSATVPKDLQVADAQEVVMTDRQPVCRGRDRRIFAPRSRRARRPSVTGNPIPCCEGSGTGLRP